MAKIARFGHVMVAAKNAEEVRDVPTSKTDFSVSDNFGDQAMFLRCFPNSFPSFVPDCKSENVDRLHHLNFIVTDVNDVGRAMNRMRDTNVPIVYRLGRHDICDSVFLYFLDPDALTAEYSFGIEEFSELTARSPCNLPRLTEVLDCRGGRPGPDFGKCGLVDSTST